MRATTQGEIEVAFRKFSDEKIEALIVGSDAGFYQWRSRIIELIARSALPCVFEGREYVTEGGLMSYGASIPDAYRQAALYVAKIINGEKPSNLPVVQPTMFPLIVNLKTAKTLGLTISSSILLRADEIIE